MNAAKGAAIGTGTTYDLQLVGSVYSLLPNETLAKVQQRALEKVGGFTYTAEERAFAQRLQKSDAFTAVPLETTARVRPLAIGAAGAGVDRRRRRELGGADGAALGGDVGARHRGALVAGGGGGRDEHRLQGDDGRGEDDGADGRGSVHDAGDDRGGEGGAGREAWPGLQVRDGVRHPETAARLPQGQRALTVGLARA